MVKSEKHLFVTKDQKKITYYTFGNPNGVPLLFYHGFPGTGKQAQLLCESHLRSEIYFIAIDRPGYGDSDPQMNLTLQKFASDIDELTTHLNVSKFINMGVSGGGPYAAAVAYYLPNKIIKSGSICGVAPITTENFKYLNSRQRKIFLMTKLLPGNALKFLVQKIYDANVNKFDQYLSTDFDSIFEKDKLIFNNPDVGPFLMETFKLSLKNGPQGMLIDMNIISKPWGFSLDQIQGPYYLWHGDRDDIVHHEMSNYMNRKIPNVKYELFKGEGHYSLPYNFRDKILEDLIR